MKTLFLVALFATGLACAAQAQVAHKDSMKMHTQHHTKMYQTKNKTKPTPSADSLNERKVYKSQKTKQNATPTGQEATGTNGSHANNPKNSSKGE